MSTKGDDMAVRILRFAEKNERNELASSVLFRKLETAGYHGFRYRSN